MHLSHRTTNKLIQKDTVISASYIDERLGIDNEGRLRTAFFDNRHNFTFLNVNLPFLCSNIPADPAYGVYHVYISQLL